jgi:hypothetical protein
MRSLLKLLAPVVFLAGCSGGPSSVAFENYCEEWVAFACSTAAHCDCLGVFSEEQCRSSLRPECVDDVENPVNAGAYSYDAVEAGACLHGLKKVAADCSTDGDDEPDACDRFLVGVKTQGQACEYDDECVSGLECYPESCTKMPTAGQACLEWGMCAWEYFCGPDDLCLAYLGSGQVCGDGLYCDDDLYCSEESQNCRPYPGQGGDCADSYGSCADDYYCSANETCSAQLPSGQACTESEECLSYDCLGGLCAEEEDDDICDHF